MFFEFILLKFYLSGNQFLLGVLRINFTITLQLLLHLFIIIFMSQIMSSIFLTKDNQNEVCHSSPKEKIDRIPPNQSKEVGKPALYFHSILCNPYLLENPTSSDQSFMQDLFLSKRIKKVKRSRDYLSVDLVQKPGQKSQNVMQTYNFKNSDLQSELKSNYDMLSQTFRNVQNLKDNQNVQTGLIQYYQWLERQKDKSIIGWYIPLSKQGIKLRSFSISLSFIKLLDYNIDDLALDIQHLGAQSIDVIDGRIYKAAFLMIVNSIKKFDQMKIKSRPTKDQILKESQCVVTNQIRGKGNKKITVETRISMASESVVCFQVIKILQKKEVKDLQRKISRQLAISQVQKVAFNCLSKVAILPKTIDPSNSSKICSYIQIKSHRASKEWKKATYQ